jgi:hypothetical protein
MKKLINKRLLLILSLLFLSMGVAAANYKCQYDNLPLYFTGQTKVENGKLVKRYKCASGHKYWIVD